MKKIQKFVMAFLFGAMTIGFTTSTYSLGGSTQKYAAPSSSTNIQLSQRNLLNADEIGQFERPYQLIISNSPPAVMYSPDISQWTFNKLLGLGNEAHNTALIEQDEKLRPERGEAHTIQKAMETVGGFICSIVCVIPAGDSRTQRIHPWIT